MSQKLKQDISIGHDLKRLRSRAGLSQEQVTARSQVFGLPISRKVLSEMELGQYSVRISILLGLKEICNASYDEFFEGLHL